MEKMLSSFVVMIAIAGSLGSWKKLGDLSVNYRTSQSLQNVCRVDFQSVDGEKSQNLVATLTIVTNREAPRVRGQRLAPGEKEPTEIRGQYAKREVAVHLAPFGMQSREFSDCFRVKDLELVPPRKAK